MEIFRSHATSLPSGRIEWAGSLRHQVPAKVMTPFRRPHHPTKSNLHHLNYTPPYRIYSSINASKKQTSKQASITIATSNIT